MRYTEDFAKRVLSKVNIVDVIKKHADVSVVGETYVAKCPFHKDAAKSMVINKDEQVFHCFDCGKGGNAITFLMELKGISMDVALNMLAKDVGITPTQDDVAKQKNTVLKANLYAIYKDAAIFYSKKLSTPDGKVAVDYIEKRGINEKSTRVFGLGYAPAKGNELHKYLKAKGYSDELMLTAGLIKISETGPYDMFRNRLMFPIMDESRRVIAFGGRVLDDDAKPKYLNSPETPIFNKSNTLYGIHDIKNADKRFFILCEGNVDVIMLHQNGLKNSVATLGTAFTQLHIPAVKKHTNNLVLSFDSDGAGKKAAMRAIAATRDSGMGLKILSMEPFKDPDEFIKNFGANEYKMRIERGVDPIDFQLKHMASQYDLNNDEQKHKYLSRAVEAIIDSQEKDRSFEIVRN